MELARKDRRTARRYTLDLPCIYRLFDRDQSVQEGRGHTRNMSSHGLLVTGGIRLAKGQPIEIFIQLPPGTESSIRTQLVVLGQVVRAGVGEAGVSIVRHGFMRVHAGDQAQAFHRVM